MVSCTNGRIPSPKSLKRLVEAFPEGIVSPSVTGDTPIHLFVSNIGNWRTKEKVLKPSTVSSIVQTLLGSGELDESKCPLLMKNSDQVSNTMIQCGVFCCCV
jgi:hypothetical protein